jgi:hypothetical protein
MPGCLRKPSSAVPAGPLLATSAGSCSGAGPVVGSGKGSVPASAFGSSFSGPNSSNISIFCVQGWAPNMGLG